MTYAAVAVGGMSLLGGLSSSKSSKSPKKKQTPLRVRRLTLINSVTTITKQCMAV